MEAYTGPLVGNLQALDFTAESIESPILDLSCKKQTPMTSDGSISSGSRSNSPASTEKQQQIGHYSDSERKSPFEGRTFMVTPPSESDSPKKTKYEPIYNCSNVTTSNNMIGQPAGFPVLPMNLPIPVVPTVLPTLFTQNNGSVQPIQMVGTSASSTTTTTTPPVKDVALSAANSESGKKAPRPFKAYPKDPLSLTMGATEMMYDPNSNEAYSEFRKRMLDSVRRSNEGTNIKMRRVTKSPGLPTSTVDEKDAAYWERRRKNNEAAKRSRDARRAKEDEIAIRAAFLEQENMKLKYELVALRNETAKLRCMVYSS
ncbi:PREDICTED: cell death specification protein 2 [Dufourea novaeangliae]|uniref:D site-binding protein n=1 Tax=Dufourea novaeangliae TaxID=178035 RepID=A0A154PHK3_DUFNO|nr:PREDICTED: cell death specification protein 2 [Dufourea novaeangliae]XP_015433423.1 PREDICTED: cell death specification protein 2 [Dufourea novaeangliae]KZC11331.1 D site-binding protein [Dufourea novaeangliae]